MKPQRIASLWSGGFDSTVMTYYLAHKGFDVIPFHILFRGGGGKDAREKESVDIVWKKLHETFPNVRKPIRTKDRIVIGEVGHKRNQLLIEIVKSHYSLQRIALGSYKENEADQDDNDRVLLSEKTNRRIITFDSYGFNSKRKIASLIPEIGLDDIIEYTRSCQLWFKKPCEQCFSCKERYDALEYIANI